MYKRDRPTSQSNTGALHTATLLIYREGRGTP